MNTVDQELWHGLGLLGLPRNTSEAENLISSDPWLSSPELRKIFPTREALNRSLAREDLSGGKDKDDDHRIARSEG